MDSPLPKSFTFPLVDPLRQQSTPSLESHLQPSAYDGSHLSWQDYRASVLAPHGIHIISQPPKDRLPFELWNLIDSRSQNSGRFDEQKKGFRAQVSSGHGFGPSPLFPPNLLPPVEAGLARCMVPRFRREPLPDRNPDIPGPLYGLSVPHPGLGCGFNQYVLDPQEFSMLPHYLSVSGTNVNFETGYVSSHANIHCPFLTFERAIGGRLDQVEMANNQCAVTGAWCVRATHMLFNKAYKATVMPDLPTTFTCIIDNSFAILNFHWIDHAQDCFMAPLCKFDLKNDAHFTKFLVWMEAIGDWALKYHLPKIRAALSRFVQFSPTPTVTSIPSLALSPTSNASSESVIAQALRTTFDSIPWQFDGGDLTPLSDTLSSSTASWGSPHAPEGLTPVSRASTHSWGSPVDNSPNFPYPNGPNLSKLRDPRLVRRSSNLSNLSSFSNKGKPIAPLITSPTPPPAALQKRLNEAQDQIRNLGNQLDQQKTEYEGSIASLRDELSTVKDLLFTFLRKENVRSRARSTSIPSSPDNDCWSPNPVRADIETPRQENPHSLESDLKSPLQVELVIETPLRTETTLKTKVEVATMASVHDVNDSELEKTPTIDKKEHEQQKTPIGTKPDSEQERTPTVTRQESEQEKTPTESKPYNREEKTPTRTKNEDSPTLSQVLPPLSCSA